MSFHEDETIKISGRGIGRDEMGIGVIHSRDLFDMIQYGSLMLVWNINGMERNDIWVCDLLVWDSMFFEFSL